jgi:predicted RNase H-like HicB family nuclease
MPEKRIRKPKKVDPTLPTVIHAHDTDGVHHAVGMFNLDVLLIPEDKVWVAQGLAIDYVAQGESIEEAKKNFENGLERTIDLNLRMYGNIDGILIPAPGAVLQEATRNKASIKFYSQVSMHEVGVRSQQALPFDGVSYLQMRKAA